MELGAVRDVNSRNIWNKPCKNPYYLRDMSASLRQGLFILIAKTADDKVIDVAFFRWGSKSQIAISRGSLGQR